MRVLVCGGRDFSDYAMMGRILARYQDRIGVIIHGAARGADQLAWRWAVATGIPHEPFPADWNEHGKAAGPIRNQQMLDEGKPDLVIAFPGGKGTNDMVRRAIDSGVTVVDLR